MLPRSSGGSPNGTSNSARSAVGYDNDSNGGTERSKVIKTPAPNEFGSRIVLLENKQDGNWHD